VLALIPLAVVAFFVHRLVRRRIESA
jgi:hypothetical protein